MALKGRGLSRETPSAPVAIAFRLLDEASRQGLNRDELCCGAGFEPAAYSLKLGNLPLPALFALWEATMARLRDPGLPVALAETYQPELYGVLSLLAVTSSDLESALQRVMRFYRLWTNSSWWELRRIDSGVALAFVQPGESRLGERCDREFSLAEMTNAIRWVTGHPCWTPSEVRFAHPRPEASLRRHEVFFGSGLRFHAPHNELVLRESDLRLPMMRADRLLAAFFERHSGDLLQRVDDAPEEILRVKQAILEQLRRRVPSLQDVSRQLGIGARTLRRRLSEQGRPFKALIDEARAELARQYLEGSRHTIQEISHLLGFSQPSAFHRAFKRWTRESPRRFRVRARLGS